MSYTIVLDTETSGLPDGMFPPHRLDKYNGARVAQLAYQIYDEKYILVHEYSQYVLPDGWTMSADATKINHITDEMLESKGVSMKLVLDELCKWLCQSKYIVGHNILFDISVLQSEMYRYNHNHRLLNRENIIRLCTMKGARTVFGGKSMKLSALYERYTGAAMTDAHDALADVKATAFVFFKLIVEK